MVSVLAGVVTLNIPAGRTLVHTFPGMEISQIHRLLLYSLRGPFPLYHDMIPSCHSSGTCPECQTLMKVYAVNDLTSSSATQ